MMIVELRTRPEDAETRAPQFKGNSAAYRAFEATGRNLGFPRQLFDPVASENEEANTTDGPDGEFSDDGLPPTDSENDEFSATDHGEEDNPDSAKFVTLHLLSTIKTM